MSTPSTNPPPADATGQDAQVLLEVVEEIGLLLSEAGLPRMAARVFAYALAEDSDHYTAGELAEGLGVSAAAVSGAVRLLVQTGLLGKGRRPGARSDHYLVDDQDLWTTVMLQRLETVRRWEVAMGDAVERLGANTPGGRRLLETQAYFRFLDTEYRALQVRWHDEKDVRVAEVAAEHDR